MLMEFAEEKLIACLKPVPSCNLRIRKHLLYTGLCLIKVSMNSYNECIVTLLGHHLFFLDRADTVLRIKYNDLGPFYICKACQCCFSGISGSCSQDNDILFHCSFLRAAVISKCGRIDNAISLNAMVAPWNSSR